MTASTLFKMRDFIAPKITHTEEAQRIDALLPQFQCRRCGYPDCAHFARALACFEATPQQCVPASNPALARYLETLADPPAFPIQRISLDVSACIGCARCLKACPIDALSGARRAEHRVIDEWCSGCGLCVDACPVDCLTPKADFSTWSLSDARAAKKRYERRQTRLLSQTKEETPPDPTVSCVAPDVIQRQRKAEIEAALAAARARRRHSPIAP
ncbi:MAG: RnfABCDGE type electron transport complex subunit B [Burkholderiales bacterium]|jgi:electron transport complex protein RnfB|nr:RnfABCDGE type electron transport complex subunit B [Burkholderiales bacterium]